METTFFYNIPLTCVVKKRCTHVAVALCHALLCGLPLSSSSSSPARPRHPATFLYIMVTTPMLLVCFFEILQTCKAFQRSPNSVVCLPLPPVQCFIYIPPAFSSFVSSMYYNCMFLYFFIFYTCTLFDSFFFFS